MKKAFSLLIIIMLSVLSGCSGSIYAQYRELEQMRIIQIMGIDYDDSGVQLSLASSGGKNSQDAPAALSASASSISTALQRIRNFSCEEDLFCAHVGHILIGEEAARKGMENILSYICHSSEIRVDLPVYVMTNASARETMDSVGNSKKGISEVLQSVQAALSDRGESHIFTAAEIIRNIERNGSALVCALEHAAASEADTESTAAVYGYGVIKDYSLVQLIDRENAVGANFLMNKVGISDLMVRDLNGNAVTLEIDSGSSKLSPVWSADGHLTGLDIQAKVSAAVLEISGKGGDLDSPRYEDQLIAELEAAVSKRISSVLQLSKRLSADFMNLGSQVELCDPTKYRQTVSDFSYLLPTLEMRISVQGQLSHTYDVKDA